MMRFRLVAGLTRAAGRLAEGPLRRAAWLSLLLALLGPSAAMAQKHDPSRTVMVFAGFGYFDSTQHQWLSNLIERRAGLADKGRVLDSAVRTAAARVFASPVSRWSSFNVVTDAETLAKAYAAATGRRDVTDSGTMLAAFDRVYVLVLTGGFEHHAVLQAPYRGGVLYHPYTFASVNATLLDNASGAILLSTSTLGMQDGGVVSTVSEDSWGARYLKVYSEAATLVLGRIHTQLTESDPKSAGSARDTYAVTGAVVATATESGQLAAREFDWAAPPSPISALPNSIGVACRPTTHCVSKACQAMSGMLISAVSESLSARGYRVLPPVSWDDALLKTDSILRYKLSLPAEAMTGLLPLTKIAFEPERATYKTVAVLTGLSVASKAADRNNITMVDSYTASVNALVFRTAPSTCATLSTAPLARTDGAGLEPDEGRPATAAMPGADTRQLMYLRAARQAAQGLAGR